MLFFFYGEDEYRSSLKLQQIKEKFIKEIDPSGYNIVNIENINIENISKEFSQTGFLSSKKLVIIKNLLKQKISKDLADYLLEEIDKMSDEKEDNILVFYEDNLPYSKKQALSGDKLKIWKRLSSLKYAQDFAKLEDYKVVAWIIERFKEGGKVIEKSLSEEFLALCGNDLRVLSNEIEKLSNYCENSKVTKQDILLMSSQSVSENLFLFAEKLAEKKKSDAIKLLNEQINLGTSAQQILSMIIRQYRILLEIKSAISDNVSDSNLAKHLSLHPYVIKKSIALAKLYSLDDLKEIYKKLLELDVKLKSSKLKPKTVLNLFFLDV